MKALLLLAFVFVVMGAPAAHAWAIILASPSLQYPAKAKTEAIAAAEAEMKKLEFEGGIIHVSAPSPTRSLRFKAPGQSVNTLLPLLEKLGFAVKVMISDSHASKSGLLITQRENGSDAVTILINAKHPKFDRKMLKIGVRKLASPAKD